MNPALINAIAIFILMLLLVVFIIVLYTRNRIFVDKAIIQDGVLKSKGGRHRLGKNGKLYGIFDFFYRKGLDIDNVEDFFIISEGMPFFGVNRVLNITETVNPIPQKELEEIHKTIEEMRKYNAKKARKAEKEIKLYRKVIVPYVIPDELDHENILTDYTYSWTLETRVEAFEETQHLTKADMLIKFYIPIGLIILALALILFYPRILEAVRDPALELVNNKLTTWQEILTGFR